MLIIESTKCPRKCVYEEKHEIFCPQVLKIGQYTYICHPCKMITRTTETQLSYMSSSYWTKLFFILFFYDSFNHPCVNETVVNYSVSIISQKPVATKLIG